MQPKAQKNCLMRVAVVTLFPEMFAALTASGVTRKAFEKELVGLKLINPRDFASDRHRTVDDRPYGGGPGMVMKVGPLEGAVEAALSWFQESSVIDTSDTSLSELSAKSLAHVVYMSPQGERLDSNVIASLYQRCCISRHCNNSDASFDHQPKVDDLNNVQGLIVIAGRYEGIDERFIDRYVNQEVSIGDFVLSGGELPAMVMLDSLLRRVPGVLGDVQSFEQDSFEDGLLDYPHYTRPEMYESQHVPEILLSGDHKKIDVWRRQQALGRTWLRRPDLIEEAKLSKQDKALLEEFKKTV